MIKRKTPVLKQINSTNRSHKIYDSLKIYKMKKILFIIIILSVNVINSQIEYGKVEYKAYFGEDELLKSLGKETYEEYIKEVESEEFVLEFNKKAFVYYIKPAMNNNKNIFYYKEKDSLFSVYPNYNNEYLIFEKKDTNWEITTESKEIQGFKCFKAVSSYEVDRGKNFKKLTFPLIAWFTPEIPFSCGPFAYDNLPGVILEIQIRNITYGAKSIDLRKKEIEESKIKSPEYNKYKQITLEDYNQMRIKEMEE